MRRGATLIELAIVIALIGILGSAFAIVVAPTLNFFFYYPQSTRVNSTAADLMDIILEGDDQAKGLRYAGPSCKLGGGGGGGSGITAASTSGTVQTLTYNYVDSDYCDSSAARLAHTVTLSYDSSTGSVTRAIDGGSANSIPKYVGASSDINFATPAGVADLFHYYGSSGNDLGASPLVGSISYVRNIGTNSVQTGGTSLAVTVPASGVALGNLVVVYFAMDANAGTVSCADTKSNTYTPVVDFTNSAHVRTVVFYALVSTALVSGNTITVTLPSTTSYAVTASEFSGPNTYDVSVSAVSAVAGTLPNSGTVTTNVADELLIGAIGVEGPLADTFTAGASYTAAPPTEAGTSLGTAASNITIDPEYRVVSAAGSYAATGTITSRSWGAAMVSFYASPIYRVDVEYITSQGTGKVQHDTGQIRLKSGTDIKRYAT